MPQFEFKNGQVINWIPVTSLIGRIEGREDKGDLCRFCLEDGIGPGIVVDNVCSFGCEGNQRYLAEKFKTVQKSAAYNIIKEKETVKMKYSDYPRHPQSPYGQGTRADRIFSKIALAGSDGISLETLIAQLNEEYEEKGLEGDVRSKVSEWSRPLKNPNGDLFSLVTDKVPRKGRPKEGESADRKIAVVFKGQPNPDWAISVG